MDLRTYRFIKNTTYTQIAKDLGIDRNYFIDIANGREHPGAKLAIRIEQITEGKVPRSLLRPDLWPPEPGSHDIPNNL